VQILPEHIQSFLSKCKSKQWAGVFFSPPAQNNFECWLQPLNEVYSKGTEHFVFSPFQLKNSPRIFITPVYKNADAIELIGTNTEPNSSWENEHANYFKTTTLEAYTKQFNQYIEAIKTGVCSKAILSTIVKQELNANFNIGEYVFKLRKAYPQAFIYVFSSPFAGTWIGATPETLLNWNEDEVTTMSLAGTRQTGLPTFNFGDKEKNEQKIVTEYIGSVFKKYFNQVEINNTEELKYGEIIHLLSKFKANRKNVFSPFNILQLVEELHPTPAVGGFPASEAIQLINSVETHLRLYYSGYLGPITENAGNLAVNLRCMTLTHKNCYVFAGGGITAESLVEAEWAETRLKANALLKFI